MQTLKWIKLVLGLCVGVQYTIVGCDNSDGPKFTELGNIIVVIVTNPKFILPWVHEKFTVKFTMSRVDGYTIYLHIGCLNCPENVNMCAFCGKMQWGHKYRSARSNVYCPWALFHKTTVFTNLPNIYPPWLLLLCDQATVNTSDGLRKWPSNNSYWIQRA